jgi:hypothetical protein
VEFAGYGNGQALRIKCLSNSPQTWLSGCATVVPMMEALLRMPKLVSLWDTAGWQW